MSQPIYSQMLEGAGRWPVRYRADLEVYDRQVLHQVPPGTRFLWIVRESGTDFCRLDHPLDRLNAAYWLRQHALPMRLFMGRVTGRSDGITTGVLVRIAPDEARALLALAECRVGGNRRNGREKAAREEAA